MPRLPDLPDDERSPDGLTGKYVPLIPGADAAGKMPSTQIGGESVLSAAALTSGPPTIPGYDVVGELGRGGMGVVLKAWQVQAKRFVALKMIVPGAQTDAALLRRFQVEARASAGLSHPNIVQVYDVGEFNDWPYLSLEFCGGGSLAKKLSSAPLLPAAAARLVEKLARAVAVAHAQQIVHRDLKPANILLTPEGEPKIADFGLAKKLDGSGGNTRTGAVIGTPNYMPPEQALGAVRAIGPAADIYGLGAILYECLTGRPPFKGATPIDTLDQVRRQEIIPPRQFESKIPPELETVCMKCLSKSPNQRYGSATELADDLMRVIKGLPIKARPPGWLGRALQASRRRTTVAIAALLLLFLVAASASVWLAIKLADARQEIRSLQAPE
jgi:eukaryotic-like serine/threonine-protein kinase